MSAVVNTTERAYQFLFLVAAEADASWLDFLPPPLVDAGKRSRIGLRLLSRALAQRWRLRKPDGLRVAIEHDWLLGGSRLVRERALRLGACALAMYVQREVRRDRVAALRAALGPLHELAMTVEPIAVNVPEVMVRRLEGSYESAFAVVQEIGLGVMLMLLAEHELAVRQRVALLFPRARAEAALKDALSGGNWVDAATALRLAEMAGEGN